MRSNVRATGFMVAIGASLIALLNGRPYQDGLTTLTLGG
jgi:hypothetical protein